MNKVMYTSNASYISCWAGVYYYKRRIPNDLKQFYASSRLSFSLRIKSYAGAIRAASSVTQRLEDYWLGLRLQQMDIPAIHLVKTDDVNDTSPVILDAVENYFKLKNNDDRIFIRIAKRIGEYVAKVLGNRPITSYKSSEAAQFLDWCFDKGMSLNTVKRVFASVRSIINLCIQEYGIDCRNPFSRVYLPDLNDNRKRKPIPVDNIRQIQKDCIEIGSWSTAGIGQAYGEGYNLNALFYNMKDI